MDLSALDRRDSPTRPCVRRVLRAAGRLEEYPAVSKESVCEVSKECEVSKSIMISWDSLPLN